MTKLLQAMRRNPDATALAVLCVTLGVGGPGLRAHSLSAFSRRPLGIHWVSMKPATDALDSLRTRLRLVGCGALEHLHFPQVPR